jgi:hypothetical protein
MTNNIGSIMQEEAKKWIDLKGRWWQEQESSCVDPGMSCNIVFN